MYSDVTGIILSGGKSTRMGENKSLLKIGNRTVIEIVLELTNLLFDKVILVTNDPDEYAFLNIRMYEDIFPGKGPLSGIHSGLSYSGTDRNLIISCDMPLMKKEMLEYLINYPADKPVTIARADGFIQQLCGIYNKRCLLYADKILKTAIAEEGRESDQKKRGCKVLDLISITGAEIIDAEKLPFYEKDIYFNMNRKDEFEYVKEKLLKTAS